MRLPIYLCKSRHGIFYFRFPIQSTKIACDKRRTIRVSLATRDPTLAKRLSLSLRIAAEAIVATSGAEMTHDEIQGLLKAHFSTALEAQKAAIRSDGPLSPLEAESLRGVLQMRERAPTTFREVRDNTAIDALLVDELISSIGRVAEIEPEARNALIAEYPRAERAYLQAVLKFDGEHEHYALHGQDEVKQEKIQPDTEQTHLSALVGEFWKYGTIENRWTSKTLGEKEEHVRLLYEVIPQETAICDVDRNCARRVREVLAAYPVNRNKNPTTRGKPLDVVLAMTGLSTLHPLSVNKYLQTYSGIFGWGKRNGYCADNPFDGLALNTRKANVKPPRIAFSVDQIEIIRDALMAGTTGTGEHHRWGSLIALFTGARLNEVAQLHLSDIDQVDGFWCININDDGGKKRIKNAYSRRIVPLHTALIEHGLISYAKRMAATTPNERLFPQYPLSQSDGYGRNLGRWFNESLLPGLGIKTNQLTFHSLRHTLVRKLISTNVSLPHITAIVGHEPGTTTLRTYNRGGFPMVQLLAAIEASYDSKAKKTDIM